MKTRNIQTKTERQRNKKKQRQGPDLNKSIKSNSTPRTKGSPVHLHLKMEITLTGKTATVP